jgi:hypothetical protein
VPPERNYAYVDIDTSQSTCLEFLHNSDRRTGGVSQAVEGLPSEALGSKPSIAKKRKTSDQSLSCLTFFLSKYFGAYFLLTYMCPPYSSWSHLESKSSFIFPSPISGQHGGFCLYS